LTTPANTVPKELNGRVLHAVYDLMVAPLTFDITQFAVFASLWAEAQGFRGVFFHVVLGPYDNEGNHVWRMQTPKDKTLSVPSKYQRVNTILAPFHNIVDNAVGGAVWYDRQDFMDTVTSKTPMHTMFPPNYQVNAPTTAVMYGQLYQYMAGPDGIMGDKLFRLSAPQWARDAVRGEHGAGYVLMKTRVSNNEEHRNSDRTMWENVARYLEDAGESVVWIDDTDSVPVEILMAMMEGSKLFISDAGGPSLLPFFNEGCKGANIFWQIDEDRKIDIAKEAGLTGLETTCRLLAIEDKGQPPQHAINPNLEYIWQQGLTCEFICEKVLDTLESKGSKQ